ncbi:hypothetical protein HAZT_HAZT005604 [Hyalella azteca]|uniref:Uncharacterized protein n=1 Tax=Hyalella azteca TaxID=294128 RepID=A0A6A0GWL2_HYAAZ|nr:hypothetical protein HAZT_HAZT005604 [Hyalella azteca]
MFHHCYLIMFHHCYLIMFHHCYLIMFPHCYLIMFPHSVYTRPFSPPAYIKRPLPLIPSPSLYVEGADSGCRGAVAHTITSLAPHNKRFAELRLKGCRLRAAEQQLLLQELQAAGIRTNYWGDTRAEAFG